MVGVAVEIGDSSSSPLLAASISVLILWLEMGSIMPIVVVVVVIVVVVVVIGVVEVLVEVSATSRARTASPWS